MAQRHQAERHSVKKETGVGAAGTTFLDALISALAGAAAYNRNDQAPPAVVLWTDKERQWQALLPLLRAHLPILTFGPYQPDQRTGPAYWLRAVIAHALPDDVLPPDAVPIIYLPGISKQEIRAVEECPRPLQPLAELQYRGVLWTQRNGRDWTIVAFLQSADGGLGIETSGDNATREAAQRALLRLATEPTAHLRKEAPLRAAFFDALLNPDEPRNLLLWLNNQQEYRTGASDAAWAAFRDVCRRKYAFDPVADGPVTAAQLLGEREGAWDTVWRRFAEAPAAYPGLPELLRRARPQRPTSLFDYSESWPQENEDAEAALRERLTALRAVLPDQSRVELAELERQHAPRRGWVWAALGLAPLAVALEHLAQLAQGSARRVGGVTAQDVIDSYVATGWQVDGAAVDALASVEHSADAAAIGAALNALYRPWLEDAATALQRAVASGEGAQAYPAEPLPAPEPGTCLLFTDALRFDVGQRLAAMLNARGQVCAVDAHLAALPSVTPTAKPAVSPVATRFSGGPDLAPIVTGTNTRVTVDVLRRQLGEAGYQVLGEEEVGDPSGRAWTELGAIDGYGHQHGWKVARHLAGELRALEQRIGALLDAGWRRVVVITDHGWLMLPGGLPKVELHEHLTVVRKGRCARLKEGSSVDYQTVSWRWDSSVRIAIAPGIACFEAGREYDHGGLSPQECVTPVITIARTTGASGSSVAIVSASWRGLRCVVKTAGSAPGMLADIRTRAGDPTTSLAAAPRPMGADGSFSVLAQDGEREGEAVLVVILDAHGTVLAQVSTIVGG
jgi:hypothetical protein